MREVQKMKLSVTRADIVSVDCDGSVSDRQRAYAVAVSGEHFYTLDMFRYSTRAKAEERMASMLVEFNLIFEAA